MATQIVPEQVCYIQCNLCNTILAVSVPGNNLFHIVTVRCGHCANLLYVNMAAFSQAFPLQQMQNLGFQSSRNIDLGSSSSKYGKSSLMYSLNDDRQIIALHPPDQKRQRVPSAYNRFIREEIHRIKANNPDISHKEAFGAAAKNWAHLPHIHLGLTLEGSDQQQVINMDEGIGATGGGGDQKGPAGFY